MDQLHDGPGPQEAREFDTELAARMYREIIIPDDEPIDIPDGITPVDAFATDIATIEINGTPILLRGHQLFVWNALTELRHEEEGVLRNQVYDLGFSPNTDDISRANHWTRAIKGLTTRLNAVSDQEIIKTTGKYRFQRYQIHPGLRIHEQRLREEQHEVLYTFAQVMRTALVRMPEPRTIPTDSGDDAIELIVRDDEAIIVNNNPIFYNEHELSLLNMLLLNEGRPLTHGQLIALGLHAYAKTEEAKLETLYRTRQGLDSLLGGTPDRPVLQINTVRNLSSIGLARGIRLIDLRPASSSMPTYDEMQPVLAALLEKAPQRHQLLNTPELSHSEIAHMLTAYRDSSLSLREIYTLCVRFGVHLPDLAGTSIKEATGEIRYTDLAPTTRHGITHTRGDAAILLRTSANSLGHSERKALQKLVHDSITRVIDRAKRTPPQQRLAEFLDGSTMQAVAEHNGWPRDSMIAATLHLLPTGRPAGYYEEELPDGLQRLYHLAQNLRTRLHQGGPNIQRALRERAIKGQDYLIRLTGDWSNRIPPVSFIDMVAEDPQFAQQGKQLIADTLTLIKTYAEDHPQSPAK